ncbi:MAG: GtrA family protein [Verrucomicrobiota bacterium]
MGAVIVHNLAVFLFAETLFPVTEDSGLDSPALRANLIKANLAAFFFGNVFAYLMNAWLVFTPGRHSRLREFAIFTAIALLSFSLGLFGGPFFFGEGSSVVLAQAGFTVTSAVVNFLCRKFLVFQR